MDVLLQVHGQHCEGIATSLQVLESIDTSSEDAHGMELIAQATLASMYGGKSFGIFYSSSDP